MTVARRPTTRETGELTGSQVNGGRASAPPMPVIPNGIPHPGPPRPGTPARALAAPAQDARTDTAARPDSAGWDPGRPPRTGPGIGHWT